MLTDVERRRRLARRHLLHPAHRIDDVEEITRSVVALHASDPATVFLSVAARMQSPSIQATEEALYERRTLVRHHAMRRTLWVMDRDTARAAHAASTRKIARAERRTLLRVLADGSPVEHPEPWLDAAMTEVLAAVRSVGVTTTRRIGDELPHLRVPLSFPARRGETVDIPAHARVLLLAGFEGYLVRARPLGSWIASQYQWSLAERWLEGGFDGLASRPAAATILDLWLAHFGPGTETDLVWWTGWTKSQTKAALADCGAESVELEGGARGWVAAGDTGPIEDPPVGPWVALLPGLDPTVMGWKDRQWYLADDIAERCVDRNGNIGPTIWADGQVVGGWGQRADGEIAVEILRPLTSGHRRLLDLERDRLAELVGDTRFRVRFPSPNQRDLT